MTTHRVIEFEGKQHHFPDDATDAEIAAALEEMHPAPAAQADVRRAEPPTPALTPGTRQEAEEEAFDAAWKQWLAKTGGVLKPGQTVREAVSLWSGLVDPRTTAAQADIEHLRETGELRYGRSVPYAAAKGLAATAGFMTGGPPGAVGAEGLVRLAAISKAVDEGVKGGAITQDQGAEIVLRELTKGVGEDALFNFGIPLLGKALAKLPGAAWLGDKVGKLITKGVTAAKTGLPEGQIAPRGVTGDTDEQLAQMFDPTLQKVAPERAVIEARKALTPDPERQRAIEALTQRAGKDYVPTPGQVTGEAGRVESGVRKATPAPFQQQEKAFLGAAEEMRREVVAPAEQPSAKALGQQVVEIAEATQTAVKTRLRPVFQEASEADVRVDLTQIVNAAEDAIERNGKVPGKLLKPGELAKLQQIVADLRVPATPPTAATPSAIVGPSGAPAATMPGAPGVPASVKIIDAEAALDFSSARKADSRAMTADGAPSTWFKEIMGDMIKGADAAYSAAAVGKGDLTKRLLVARGQYREMMETVYDDAVKTALRSNPEDIGRKFWQGGNVSELEQLQRLLDMSKREGKMTTVEALEVTRSMTRGFLQEAIKDVQSASTWSQTLASDPLKRRTWETLVAGQGGSAMKDAMKVLEQAAQIASSNTVALAGGNIIPLSRAMGGGMGQSYVTGTISPGMFLAGFNIAGLTKALATAYVQGNRGMINTISAALRASSVKTPAATKALQDLLPRLDQWAADNNLAEIFVGEQQ